MRKLWLFLVVSCALAVQIPTPAWADAASAKKELAEKGIRVTRSSLQLKEEIDLSKAFGEAASLKRKLLTAARTFNELQAQDAESQDAFDGVLQQNVQLAQQLKETPHTNLQLYNNIVGEINATGSELRQMDKMRKEFQGQLDAARSAVNSARETYTDKILQIRALADRIPARYAELAKDQQVRSLLDEWNASQKKPLSLEVPRTLKASLRKLEALEKTVSLAKIPLRRVGNNFLATVVINGSNTIEMMIDTGASHVVLPYALAVKFGLDLDHARAGKATIADGSTINTKIVKLESVRVGKFTAKNVECGVAPPSATRAPALLGMAFLGRFNFQLNGAQLVISEINTNSPGAKHKTDSKKPVKKRKSEPGNSTSSNE